MSQIEVTLKAIKLIEYLEKEGFSIDKVMHVIKHDFREANFIEIQAINWLMVNYGFDYEK
jgi:hypothetical protein